MTGADFLIGEALRIAGLWLLNLVGLAAADGAARYARLSPESARKLIHVTAGSLAIPLPWVIRSTMSMIVLAVGGLLALLACRRLGLLRSIHRVERASAGDLLFPVGIALLYFVGHGQPMLYLVGLSYMVLADALAALVGRRYGRASYAVELQRKSVEGSVTFFVVSFLTAHLILLLGAGVPPLKSVLVATQLALLATCFEAISAMGNDNLLVPLATCLIVARLVELPTAILGRDLVVQLATGSAVALATLRWRFAGATGAVTLALFLYGAYALGGPMWVAAPLLVVASFVALRTVHSHGTPPSDSHHQVVAVFYVTVVGAALYFVAATGEVLGMGSFPSVLLAPYLGASAGHLAILVYTLWRPWDAPLESLDPGSLPALLAAVAISPLALFAPGGVARALLWTVLTPFFALGVYRAVRRGSSWPRAVPWNSRLQSLAVAAALAVVAPFHLSLFLP